MIPSNSHRRGSAEEMLIVFRFFLASNKGANDYILASGGGRKNQAMKMISFHMDYTYGEVNNKFWQNTISSE